MERACAGCAGCDGFAGCTGWLGCDGFAGFVRAEVDGLVRFVWPGALADLPRGFAGLDACFFWACFWWPGAFAELPAPAGGPWPFPASAAPVNTASTNAVAIVAPRRFLR